LEALSPTNRASLDTIDTALMVVVLEDTDDSNTVDVSTSLLHGGGLSSGSSRWYDKHQIVSYPGGTLGVNFEHSFSDGMTWNRWLSEIDANLSGTDSGYRPLPEPESYAGSLGAGAAVEPLEWVLDQSLGEAIEGAEAEFEDATSGLETEVYTTYPYHTPPHTIRYHTHMRLCTCSHMHHYILTILSPHTHRTLTIHSPYTHHTLTMHSPCTHQTLTTHSSYTHHTLTTHSPHTHHALTMHSPCTRLRCSTSISLARTRSRTGG
jgi:hypothetical protein